MGSWFSLSCLREIARMLPAYSYVHKLFNTVTIVLITILHSPTQSCKLLTLQTCHPKLVYPEHTSLESESELITASTHYLFQIPNHLKVFMSEQLE